METQTSRVTAALRGAGILLLVSSGVIFMLQGVWALGSFERFLSFAALAGSLGLLGIIAGTRFREPKTARVFLGLAAAATPVIYSQLGAIVHAGLSEIPSSVPEALTVAAPTFLAGTVAVIATTAIMAPLLFLGFAAFYRQRAKYYVLMMLAGCAALLIPSRAPEVAALLVLAATGGLAWFHAAAEKQRDPAGRLEQWVAGLLPLAPIAVLMGRALFYPSSRLLTGAEAALFSALCLIVIPALARRESVRGMLFTPGVLFGSLAWFMVELEATTRLGLSDETRMLVCVYLPSIAMVAISNRFNGHGALHVIGAVFAFSIPLLAAFTSWTIGSAFLLTGFGLLATALGFSSRSSTIFANGTLTTLLGLGFFAAKSVSYAVAAPWISLAALGIAVIIAAAWIERNAARLGPWSTVVREYFDVGPAKE